MIRFWRVTRWLDQLRLVMSAFAGLAVTGWTIASIDDAVLFLALFGAVNLFLYGIASYASQWWYAKRWQAFYRQPDAKKMRAFQSPIAEARNSEVNQWPRVVAACDMAFAYAVSGWYDHAKQVLDDARAENAALLEKNDWMRYRVTLQEANLDLLQTGGEHASFFAEAFADLAQKVYLSHQEAVLRQVRFFGLVAQLHSLDWQTALASLASESGSESRHRYLTRMYVLQDFYAKNDNLAEAKRIQDQYRDASAELVTTYSPTAEPPLEEIVAPRVPPFSTSAQRKWIAAIVGVSLVVVLLSPLAEVWGGWGAVSISLLVALGATAAVLHRRIDHHRLSSLVIWLGFLFVYLLAQVL